jgi:hypothetical protein
MCQAAFEDVFKANETHGSAVSAGCREWHQQGSGFESMLAFTAGVRAQCA